MKRVFLLASLAVVLAVMTLSPEVLAICWASRTCTNGTTLQCEGTTCSSGLNWVQCNGQRQTCPQNPCSQQIICPAPYPRFKLGCYNPDTSACSHTSTSVRCGSVTYTCAQCQSGAINCQLVAEP